MNTLPTQNSKVNIRSKKLANKPDVIAKLASLNSCKGTSSKFQLNCSRSKFAECLCVFPPLYPSESSIDLLEKYGVFARQGCNKQRDWCLCLCACVRACVCVCVSLSLSIYIYIFYACVCVCVFVCVCVWNTGEFSIWGLVRVCKTAFILETTTTALLHEAELLFKQLKVTLWNCGNVETQQLAWPKCEREWRSNAATIFWTLK